MRVINEIKRKIGQSPMAGTKGAVQILRVYEKKKGRGRGGGGDINYMRLSVDSSKS